MAQKDGGPAFPAIRFADSGEQGMTLRDYFAAAALEIAYDHASGDIDDAAIVAYHIADAMLTVREGKGDD